MDDLVKAAAVTGSAAAAGGGGTVTVATITSSAPGLLGALGFTTTTTIALPLVGVAVVSGAVGYGLYKGIKKAQQSSLGKV